MIDMPEDAIQKLMSYGYGQSGGSTSGAANWGQNLNKWLSDYGVMGKTMGDGTKTPGWGGLALGVGESLLGGYLGLEKLGLAKDQFGESKRQWNLDYGNRVQDYNTKINGRRNEMLAANPNANVSHLTTLRG